MLKQRIIPILLLKKGRMVKGVNFSNHVDVGNPVTTAKVYDAQGVDELVLLDIEPTGHNGHNKKIVLDIVEETAESCFVPLTVGGKVHSLRDIQDFLNVGADKITVNTAAVENPDFVRRASEKYGSQCIVVSVDVKQTRRIKYEVFIHSGTVATGLDVIDWCKQLVKYGVGEIMITSIDREGTMKGYDLKLVKKVADNVNVLVIASGGAGTLAHFEEGLNIDGISAVAASSIFNFTDQSPIKARFYLSSKGLNVRNKF